MANAMDLWQVRGLTERAIWVVDPGGFLGGQKEAKMQLAERIHVELAKLISREHELFGLLGQALEDGDDQAAGKLEAELMDNLQAQQLLRANLAQAEPALAGVVG